MKPLRYTIILTGDLHAAFADKFDALKYAEDLYSRRPGSCVEVIDTKIMVVVKLLIGGRAA